MHPFPLIAWRPRLSDGESTLRQRSNLKRPEWKWHYTRVRYPFRGNCFVDLVQLNWYIIIDAFPSTNKIDGQSIAWARAKIKPTRNASLRTQWRRAFNFVSQQINQLWVVNFSCWSNGNILNDCSVHFSSTKSLQDFLIFQCCWCMYQITRSIKVTVWVFKTVPRRLMVNGVVSVYQINSIVSLV